MYILDIAPFENAFRRYYYFFVGDHTLFPIRTLDTVHIILHERCLFCIHTVKATHRLYPHFTITNYSLGSEFHWKKIQHFFFHTHTTVLWQSFPKFPIRVCFFSSLFCFFYCHYSIVSFTLYAKKLFYSERRNSNCSCQNFTVNFKAFHRSTERFWWIEI